MLSDDLAARYASGQEIARKAGELALTYFGGWARLKVDTKGHQDFVSEADREVELAIRNAIARAFPDDAIVGEEGAPKEGRSGFTWVIDPIDGTTNFVNGIPQWCVILACVHAGRTVTGVVHDPVHNELHHAARGEGAFCNDRRIYCSGKARLTEGSLAVGFSGRRSTRGIKRLVDLATDAGTVFWRNGSGGLSLAYVASGRVLGYIEEHMNAWDFLAGHLIVAEAGGRTEHVDADRAIAQGERVVVACPGVFDAVKTLADEAFS